MSDHSINKQASYKNASDIIGDFENRNIQRQFVFDKFIAFNPKGV
jgi:hypothetical protein